ncbi:MAG TPA: hypothetical protein VMV57_02400, partial [Terracidiphilus sp.]|nr:hypothetical protein [Terracidiphilus sp.]
DMVFRAQESNGFGDGKLETLFLLLRGLPFQSIEPEYDNAGGRAVNVQALLRWDAQKRRAYVRLSGPLQGSAVHRFAFTLDLRNENWEIRRSFTGPAPVLASLNLRREVGAFQLLSSARDRLQWSAGGELSHRDYRSVTPGAVFTPGLLAAGFELKQTAQIRSSLLRVPERRFTLAADASSQAARLWSPHPQAFEKLQASLESHWFPRATGRDYETTGWIRAGRTFGQPPFDELFQLGLERDNDLPMRAHIGTRDGRKGSAPLGRNYLLASWQTDKILYTNGLTTFTLGPFVDTGHITDPAAGLGSRAWLVDTGAQAGMRIFGTVVAFSYGKDLRTGNNAFYLRLLASD